MYYDEKIKYIPPIPEREGYTFEGWYTETACINEWDFNNSTIVFDKEIYNITKLYAKWCAL